jgi:hypothetical protein
VCFNDAVDSYLIAKTFVPQWDAVRVREKRGGCCEQRACPLSLMIEVAQRAAGGVDVTFIGAALV